MSLTQAGRWPPIRGPPARLFGSSGRRFPPRFDAGRETTSVVTHVESCGDVLSDAGSTPAASTNLRSASVGGVAGTQAGRLRPCLTGSTPYQTSLTFASRGSPTGSTPFTTSLAFGELRLGKPSEYSFRRSLSRRSSCPSSFKCEGGPLLRLAVFRSALRSRRVQYFSTLRSPAGSDFSRTIE
jgi:hypothetical protein